MYQGDRTSSRSQLLNQSNLAYNRPDGVISEKAERRIKTAIDWLCATAEEKTFYTKARKVKSKFRVNFITLTLPSLQAHSDNVIKKECLNHFLTILRTKYKCSKYVWKAEAQQNGNIHFHIASDVFIHHTALRNHWNTIIEKLCYVSRYASAQVAFHAAGFKFRPAQAKKRTYAQQLASYQLSVSQKWQSPNTTDVHSVRHITDISAYLAKYCAKNGKPNPDKVKKYPTEYRSWDKEQQKKYRQYVNIHCIERALEGNLWGLSEVLSKLKSAVIEMGEEAFNEWERIKGLKPTHVKRTEFGECMYINWLDWAVHVRGVLFQALFDYTNAVLFPPVLVA